MSHVTCDAAARSCTTVPQPALLQRSSAGQPATGTRGRAGAGALCGCICFWQVVIIYYIVQKECNLAKMITLFQAPFLFQHCTRCELGVCKLNPDSVVWHTDASFAQYSSFNFAPREVGGIVLVTGHSMSRLSPFPNRF